MFTQDSTCYLSQYIFLLCPIKLPAVAMVFMSSLQNGHIFVFTGILQATENTEQLGVVLGHEMAHVVLNHSVSLFFAPSTHTTHSRQAYIVSWEPEGRYCNSKMFRWEPEGRYCCTKSMAIAPFWFSREHLCSAIMPFWFSREHLCSAITPFWLSTDDMCIHLWSSNSSYCSLMSILKDSL